MREKRREEGRGEGEERRGKGGRKSLGSKEEDQGVDRLRNGIAPVAEVPAVIVLEQHLYTGSFSYSLYFAS